MATGEQVNVVRDLKDTEGTALGTLYRDVTEDARPYWWTNCAACGWVDLEVHFRLFVAIDKLDKHHNAAHVLV